MKPSNHGGLTSEPWTSDISQDHQLSGSTVDLQFSGRTNNFGNNVPNPIYSSLKYKLNFTITGQIIKLYPLLHCSLSVRQEESNKTTLISEVVVITSNQSCSGVLHMHIDSSFSTHSTKKQFHLVFVVSSVSENITFPLITMVSPGLECYARKPNKKKPKSKNNEIKQIETTQEKTSSKTVSTKRKIEKVEITETLENPTKKQMMDELGSTLDLVDSLIKKLSGLDYIERRTAENYVFRQIQQFQLATGFYNPFECPVFDSEFLDLLL
jgi:hypothetical protein